MKTCLYFIFCCLTCITSNAQPYGYKKTDLQDLNLKGKVRSVTSFYQENRAGQMDAVKHRGNVTLFNKRGDATAIYEYDYNDKLRFSMFYFYDGNGRKLQEKDAHGKIINRYKYQLINPHKAIEETVDAKGRVISKTVREILGNREVLTVYNESNTIIYKGADIYDNRHNLIENIKDKRYLSKPDKLSPAPYTIWRTKYTYDEKNNKLSETSYDLNNKITIWSRFKYDKLGNDTLQIDSNNARVGGIAAWEQKGNLTIKRSRYPQIDKYGNWLQQDFISEGKVFSRITRTIEYYQ